MDRYHAATNGFVHRRFHASQQKWIEQTDLPQRPADHTWTQRINVNFNIGKFGHGCIILVDRLLRNRIALRSKASTLARPDRVAEQRVYQDFLACVTLSGHLKRDREVEA
jgi:hypothetical protein